MGVIVSEEPSGCLLAFLRVLGLSSGSNRPIEETPREDEDELAELEAAVELPYRIRDDFLSPTERAFFAALVTAVGQTAVVCPKVRLGDILFATDRSRSWKHTNRINQKHTDFLICSIDRFWPLVAIELDDKSHERRNVKERDLFKDAAFKSAGLPLIRIQARREYDPVEIHGLLSQFLGSTAPPGPVLYLTPAEATAPICPKCGVPMVVRTASKGGNSGKQFYGCSNYPRCRQMADLP